ncbi:MAG: response regulator transcription factor [Pseudomonadales bacterium]
MAVAKYFVVDDDLIIHEMLSQGFGKYGIECDFAKSAEEARERLKDAVYDLVIVDVVMPGENGIELTKWIKAEKNLPVIMLSGLDDPVDMVAGLEIGADDYVSKPFDFRVLLARAKAVQRRYSEIKDAARIEEKQSAFSISHRVLSNGDSEYQLSVTEFGFIQLLVDAGAEAVSREALSKTLFGREWRLDDRAIDNLVSKLRQKVEPIPGTPRYIVTVRHKGYMIPEGVFDIVS